MNTYTATVIKTGNSIALRVPKDYAVTARLTPGDRVLLPLPAKQGEQDHAKIVRILTKLQALHAYASIDDPVAWQRQLRTDRDLPSRDLA